MLLRENWIFDLTLDNAAEVHVLHTFNTDRPEPRNRDASSREPPDNLMQPHNTPKDKIPPRPTIDEPPPRCPTSLSPLRARRCRRESDKESSVNKGHGVLF